MSTYQMEFLKQLSTVTKIWLTIYGLSKALPSSSHRTHKLLANSMLQIIVRTKGFVFDPFTISSEGRGHR